MKILYAGEQDENVFMNALGTKYKAAYHTLMLFLTIPQTFTRH